jgi:hypothetical protein
VHWGNEGFIQAALAEAKNLSQPRVLPKPSTTEEIEAEELRTFQVLGCKKSWCEEGDLNPYAISGTSPSN